MISILLPVWNEERSIEQTIRQIHQTLTSAGEEFEILAVNDGSTDRSLAVMQGMTLPNLKVMSHPINRGYSASLKTGIRHSRGELIGIVDADQTYPVQEFPRLLAAMREAEADMVVGARTKKGAHIPLLRRPAKAIVSSLARLLTGMRIPDLNSGMRIFTRILGERFLPLYPQRFSFTITITLAALTNDYVVTYVPIDYFKREGKSSLSSGMNGIGNFLGFLSLILRMVTHFRPLRVFIWPAMILMGGGVLLTLYTVIAQANVSDSGVLLIVSGLQIFLFGLLAEAVVRHRDIR